MRYRLAVPILVVTMLAVATVSSPAFAQFPGHPGRFVSRANGLTTYARDGSHPRTLDLGAKLDGVSAEYPSYAPNGKWIVFDAQPGGDIEIFRVRARGGTAKQLTHNTATDWGANQGPDAVVFVCERPSSEEICTMHLDGSHVRRLTNNDAEDWNPKWSPNGQKIVFSSDRHGNHDIYSMKADGSGTRRLTRAAADELEPDFSPNGKRIVFWMGTAESQLVVMDADGRHRNVLAVAAPYPSDPRTPVWSPNGTRIAFGVGDQIWTRKPNDDTSAIKIVVTSGSDDNIGWQPVP